MSFSLSQVRKLRARLRPGHIKTREADGISLSYIEGWHVVAEANRIFGFDGWERETVASDCVWTKQMGARYCAAYVTRVRIRVWAGERLVVREGSGAGESNAASPGQAHEFAAKAAETDATKRAFMTFGNVFGLSLYGGAVEKSPRLTAQPGGSRSRSTDLENADGAGLREARPANTQALPPDPFPDHALSAVQSAELLDRDFSSSRSLPQGSAPPNPELTPGTDNAGTPEPSSTGLHNMEVGPDIHEMAQPALASDPASFSHTVKSQAPAISIYTLESQTPSLSAPPAWPLIQPLDEAQRLAAGRGVRIDKACLAISEPRRIRDLAHLAFVASRPCLICGRNRAHAHHLKFAQPTALGRKVSDEFTVPLCSKHHRELHQHGDERKWWAANGIDALNVARELWTTRGCI